MCYGHQDSPCRGQASGDGIWGKKITNTFLHLRDEKQKQTNFVNSDYHLGSYNLLHKKKKMNSFVIMRGFFFFFFKSESGIFPATLGSRKSPTNRPLARRPRMKGGSCCFVRLLDPHTRPAGRSPSLQGQGHCLSRQSHLGSETRPGAGLTSREGPARCSSIQLHTPSD